MHVMVPSIRELVQLWAVVGFGDWPDTITWAAIVQAVAAVAIVLLTRRLANLSAEAIERDRERVERDDKEAARVKPTFLRAVAMELDALSDQLDSSYHIVREGNARFLPRESGVKVSPHYTLALRTAVYSSQLGKLKSVDDELIISIIHFYSDLGTLEGVLAGATEISDEYNRLSASGADAARTPLRGQVESVLMVLEEELKISCQRLRKVREKVALTLQTSERG
jgi:hypothetical protein